MDPTGLIKRGERNGTQRKAEKSDHQASERKDIGKVGVPKQTPGDQKGSV